MDTPQGLQAIIFDFDGVIVDSESVHFRLFRKILAEYGIDLTRDAYDEHYLGMDDRECFTTILGAHGKGSVLPQVPALIERKSAMLMSDLNHRIPLLPGVDGFIRAAAARVPLAVCSGALRREIEAMLQMAGLLEAFVGIVSAEDVTRGKPDPEGYLAALKLLDQTTARDKGIRPQACLVVEDSIAGIEAARAAGMRCLAVTNSYPAEALKAAGADVVVRTLEGDPLADVPPMI